MAFVPVPEGLLACQLDEVNMLQWPETKKWRNLGQIHRIQSGDGGRRNMTHSKHIGHVNISQSITLKCYSSFNQKKREHVYYLEKSEIILGYRRSEQPSLKSSWRNRKMFRNYNKVSFVNLAYRYAVDICAMLSLRAKINKAVPLYNSSYINNKCLNKSIRLWLTELSKLTWVLSMTSERLRDFCWTIVPPSFRFAFCMPMLILQFSQRMHRNEECKTIVLCSYCLTVQDTCNRIYSWEK